MVDPVYGRALSRAADILGDKNLLREELRVSTPLFGRNGRLFGMISTHRAAPRAFSPRDLELLDRVARRTAFWLEGGA